MTIQTEINKNNYIGDGVQTVYTYGPYRVDDASHMKPYLDDILQTSGFTVQGVGVETGGTVTFSAPPGSGVRVTLIREVPFTQSQDYTAFDRFPAEETERALDKTTMLDQQLRELNDRQLTVPVSDTASTDLPPRESNKFLGTDGSGNYIYRDGVQVGETDVSASTVIATGASVAVALQTLFMDPHTTRSFTDMAQALAAIQIAGGGELRIANLTIPLGGLSLAVPNNCKIEGAGRASAITITGAGRGPNDHVFKATGASNIDIGGFYINGDRPNTTNQIDAFRFTNCDSVNLRRMRIEDCGAAAAFVDCRDSSAVKFWVNGALSQKSGFVLDTLGTIGCERIDLLNNIVKNTSDEAIDINGLSTDVLVDGLKFFNIHTDGPDGEGEVIDVGAPTLCSIINIMNVIGDANLAARYGIRFKTNCADVSVSHCKIRNLKAAGLTSDVPAGIAVANTDGCTIDDVSINGARNGLKVHAAGTVNALKVSQFRARNVHYRGMDFDPSLTECNGVEMSDITLDGGGQTNNRGMNIQKVKGADFTNVQVDGFDAAGIFGQSDSTDLRFYGGHVRGCGDQGINLQAPRSKIVGMLASGNTQNGVSVAGADSTVSGVTSESNGQRGLRIEAGADRLNATGNHFINNTGVGTGITGAVDRIILSDNQRVNNTGGATAGESNATNSIIAGNIDA